MKKSFKLLSAVLMALAMFVPAQANETLTIYDGVGSSNYVPFRNIDFQDNGMHSQLIYPAEQISVMAGQQINSVTFYLKDESGMMADGGKLLVKMGETDRATYTNAADFRTDLVEVASMALTPSVTELVIELSNPYTYTGGNLVIDFSNTEAGGDNWFGWNSWNGETQGSNYTAIGSNGAMATFLPKATFDYGVPQEWDARVNPLELTFNIPAEREELQTITILNKGLNAFTPVISTLNAPLSCDVEPAELAMGQTLEIPVMFAPAVPGDYSTTMTIDCGAAGNFEVVINAVATDPIYEVTVGSKVGSDELLPLRCYYMDEVGTYGQMIYTEEMMGDVKNNKITKVTFYPTTALSSSLANGKIQLSFKNAGEQIEFIEATAMTEMSPVANTVINGGETELVFVLDEPYEYTGGSLAIEALCVEKSSFSKTYFYGEGHDYSPSLYHYSSTTKTSNFLPMATFTYDKAQAPQPTYDLGDVNHDHAVNVADVTDLIKYILTSGSEPEVFYPEEANVDGIEPINVADVTALIQSILQN